MEIQRKYNNYQRGGGLCEARVERWTDRDEMVEENVIAMREIIMV